MSGYYERAFSRNIGLFSEQEQQFLRSRCVAIPGMGGAGGVYVATLARTGIGCLRIADFDEFDVVNMNRQYGASTHTIGRMKTDVMAEIATGINPEMHVTVFHEGISEANIDAFLDGADIAVDALDFFNPDIHRLLFRKAREKGLHVVTAAPFGFSAAMLVFSPTGMSFDEYFGFTDTMSLEEKLILFAVGVAPGGTHLSYMNPKNIDFEAKLGPSLGLSCQLISAMAVAEVVKILLRRGPVKAAPYYSQFDPYTQQYKRGYLWRGNRHPLQRIKIAYVKRLLSKGKRMRELAHGAR